jgi:hypothetical protein
MSLVGLQGLASKYGADAKAVSAGKAATQQLLSWALQQLDEVFDGDVTMQVRVSIRNMGAKGGNRAAACHGLH